MIDLRPSPEQQQIIDAISRFVQDRFPLDRLQPGKSLPHDERSAWSELAAQGFFALSATEDVGGAGFTVVEEMLAQREFARAQLSPCVLAASLAVHIAFADGQTGLAAAIAAGERQVAIAIPIDLTGSDRLNGVVNLIDSQPGDLIVALAGSGPVLFKRDDAGGIEALAAMDETLGLHRAELRNAVPLARANDLADRWTLLCASALLGMAESARDIAVEHAKVREQFGKPIGAFQGVAHHCADMEIRARSARAQTAFAAIALAHGRADSAFHVAAAGLVAGEAAIFNAMMGIRILGAMGFTAECPLHVYLKRAHLFEALAGGRRRQTADLLRLDGAMA